MEVQYSCNPNYVIVLYNAITKCLWSLRRIHSVFLINFVIFLFDELIMKYCIITFSTEYELSKMLIQKYNFSPWLCAGMHSVLHIITAIHVRKSNLHPSDSITQDKLG